MRKFLGAALALVVTLALLGVAGAAGAIVSGEVTAVDTKANTVTVKTDTGDVTVAVTPKDIGTIKKGAKVTIETTEKDGKKTAVKIDVKAPGKAPAYGC